MPTTPTAWPNTPEEILAQLLVELGVGAFPPVVSPHWCIVDSNEPDTPDNCITVYSTSSVLFGRENITGDVLEHPGFQIRIRSTTNNVGRAKGNALKTLLDRTIASNTVTLGGVSYCVHAFNRSSGVTFIGKDTPRTKRSLHTINGTAWIVLLN